MCHPGHFTYGERMYVWADWRWAVPSYHDTDLTSDNLQAGVEQP